MVSREYQLHCDCKLEYTPKRQYMRDPQQMTFADRTFIPKLFPYPAR